ncbi:MAG: malate synthase [Mycobacterium sp.]|jgi:malate synthase|nr:malate synthase [Mycobacterium sp.]MDT5280921.1 malate synthase [Mycobacterium sp.]
MPAAVVADVGSAVVSYRPAAGKEASEPVRDIAVEALLRQNVEVGIRYINLMDDATAEISRSPVWKWVYNAVRLSSGETAPAAVVRSVIDKELSRVRGRCEQEVYDAGRFKEARRYSSRSRLPRT